jgi:hypothetical protein
MAKKADKKPKPQVGLDTGMGPEDLKKQEKHLERLFFKKDGTPRSKKLKFDPVD